MNNKKKNAESHIKITLTTMASWKVITGKIERTANYLIRNGNNKILLISFVNLSSVPITIFY